MPTEVTPAKFQNTVKQGFGRTNRYCKASAMFVRSYVGQYYREYEGMTGDEPLNLLFNTIKTFVPNLVTNSPINDVGTEFLGYREYADMLGLAIDKVETDIKLKETIRAWVVSALFGLGVMKVSLASSENYIQHGDIRIDPGQVYAAMVDMEDFVFDPICTNLSESSFLGNRTRVSRQILLDTDGYDHDEVMKLPVSTFGKRKLEGLSQKSAAVSDTFSLQDIVDIVECWVPEANALVSIPDPTVSMSNKYLRVTDYYGPREGSYTFLSFSPPVPKNPLPVAPVSIWYDLHRIANRTFKRLMNQVDRQRDIMLYPPGLEDEADEIRLGNDGDCLACTDPKAFNVVSFGGSNPQNEFMVQQLQMWYNYMAGNPDSMAGNQAGNSGGKETATKTATMQGNSAVGLEDSRGIVQDRVADISKKIAWYLHHDPLINLPLTKRTTGNQFQQITLTPEQRQGDFLNFAFKIRARSMVPMDPALRSRRMMEFATNVMPAIMNSAMMAMQMGVPFNVMRALTDMAESQGITSDVQSWLDDPEFAQRIEFMQKMGPQNAGKAALGPGSMQSNGSLPSARPIQSPEQEFNSDAQQGANGSQSMNQDY